MKTFLFILRVLGVFLSVVLAISFAIFIVGYKLEGDNRMIPLMAGYLITMIYFITQLDKL